MTAPSLRITATRALPFAACLLLAACSAEQANSPQGCGDSASSRCASGSRDGGAAARCAADSGLAAAVGDAVRADRGGSACDARANQADAGSDSSGSGRRSSGFSPPKPGSVVDLRTKGLSPGDDLSPWLDKHWKVGSKVIVPGGKYRLSDPRSFAISADKDSWLLGDGEVIADHGKTHVEFNIVAKGKAHVRIENFTLRGKDDSSSSNDGKIRVFATSSGGLSEVVNFNRPDGAVAGAEATGFYVPKPHAGVARFINCHIEAFTDNGIYASNFAEGTSSDGMGTVEVYGGLYKNNNVNNVRVGGDDSKVIGVVSVVDAVPNGQKPGARRGLRVREAGENQIVHDCDFYVADVAGAGTAILVKDGKFEGPPPSDVRVTNTRIHNDIKSSAIATYSASFDISGDAIDLTGKGSLKLEGAGPFTNVRRGSSAKKPTTTKRWHTTGPYRAKP